MKAMEVAGTTSPLSAEGEGNASSRRGPLECGAFPPLSFFVSFLWSTIGAAGSKKKETKKAAGKRRTPN
jgi:hypothetical protein